MKKQRKGDGPALFARKKNFGRRVRAEQRALEVGFCCNA